MAICLRSDFRIPPYFPGCSLPAEPLTGTRGIRTLLAGTRVRGVITGMTLGGGTLTRGILMTGPATLTRGTLVSGLLLPVLWKWWTCTTGGRTRRPPTGDWPRGCTRSPSQIFFSGGWTSVQLLTWLYAPHVHTLTPSGWEILSPSFTIRPPMLHVPVIMLVHKMS